MADKRSPEETARIFEEMTKAMVSGNPKPKTKAKPKKKVKKKSD